MGSRSITELEADIRANEERTAQIRSELEERVDALVEIEVRFKNELIALRKVQGLSRETVAERMGVSPEMVEEFEHYASHPRINIITHYAMAVGAQIDLKITALPPITDEDMDLLQEEG